MHGPTLTKPEIVATLRCGVARLVAQGIGSRTAVRLVARKYGVTPKHVSALIAQVEPLPGGEV